MHASTQLTVHNLSGALEAKQLGFSRVVLAREMSRSEIAAIASQAQIETEVFVHGALCMCVSGQCYMSSVIGERSGNRGLCAQPCRLPFSSGRKGDSGYALSLKDLSLAHRVQELVQLGVDSFKIEGRMKRPEYVAAAVSQFKQALEGQQADMDLMAAVFSRSGFTQGYFDGKLGQEMFGHPTEGGCAGRTKGAQKLKRPGFQRCAAGRGGLCFFDVQRPAGHPVCAGSRGTSGAGERVRCRRRRSKRPPPRSWSTAVWKRWAGPFICWMDCAVSWTMG